MSPPLCSQRQGVSVGATGGWPGPSSEPGQGLGAPGRQQLGGLCGTLAGAQLCSPGPGEEKGWSPPTSAATLLPSSRLRNWTLLSVTPMQPVPETSRVLVPVAAVAKSPSRMTTGRSPPPGCGRGFGAAESPPPAAGCGGHGAEQPRPGPPAPAAAPDLGLRLPPRSPPGRDVLGHPADGAGSVWGARG